MTSPVRAVVINASAYTAVDDAETDATPPTRERAGPAHLARRRPNTASASIHVSTDYVFPGDGTRPYEVDDPTGPKSVYGASKLAGEQAVLAAYPEAHVVRTAWVWGATGGELREDDGDPRRRPAQHQPWSTTSAARPTYAADLAAGLLELATPTPVRAASCT